MSTPTQLALVDHTQPAHLVVRRLLMPAVRSPQAPVRELVPIGPARSAFWQHQLDMRSRVDEQTLKLSEVEVGVSGIGTQIDKIVGRSHFSVTTSMSSSDAERLERGVSAMEALAEKASPAADACSALRDMSDLAFSIHSRLSFLATQLMDRHAVTAATVAAKLRNRATVGLVADTLALMRAHGATEAAELLLQAVSIELFDKLAQANGSPYEDGTYAELNRRAALLLAASCRVATTLTGPAADWPPPAVGPRAPQKTPQKARKTAA